MTKNTHINSAAILVMSILIISYFIGLNYSLDLSNLLPFFLLYFVYGLYNDLDGRSFLFNKLNFDIPDKWLKVYTIITGLNFLVAIGLFFVNTLAFYIGTGFFIINWLLVSILGFFDNHDIFKIPGGHRQFSHTGIFVIIVTLISSLIYYKIYSEINIIAIIVLFILSHAHLIADSFTVSGVPYLWPLTDYNIGLKFIRTGKDGEKIFNLIQGLIGIALIIFLFWIGNDIRNIIKPELSWKYVLGITIFSLYIFAYDLKRFLNLNKVKRDFKKRKNIIKKIIGKDKIKSLSLIIAGFLSLIYAIGSKVGLININLVFKGFDIGFVIFSFGVLSGIIASLWFIISLLKSLWQGTRVLDVFKKLIGLLGSTIGMIVVLIIYIYTLYIGAIHYHTVAQDSKFLIGLILGYIILTYILLKAWDWLYAKFRSNLLKTEHHLYLIVNFVLYCYLIWLSLSLGWGDIIFGYIYSISEYFSFI